MMIDSETLVDYIRRDQKITPIIDYRRNVVPYVKDDMLAEPIFGEEEIIGWVIYRPKVA